MQLYVERYGDRARGTGSYFEKYKAYNGDIVTMGESDVERCFEMEGLVYVLEEPVTKAEGSVYEFHERKPKRRAGELAAEPMERQVSLKGTELPYRAAKECEKEVGVCGISRLTLLMSTGLSQDVASPAISGTIEQPTPPPTPPESA